MANPEHVAIVKQGAEILNKWRQNNPGVKLDLSYADLSVANLNYADLSVANLSSTNLRAANLSNANLRAADLSDADLSNADLSYANLRAADLSSAILIDADLKAANLRAANLSVVNLSSANLRAADLRATQALGTNFQQAILTGACIEDWNINSHTILERAICEYIFLKQEVSEYGERRPSSGNFAQGDFAKLVQESISTVDLIFRNGINWEAFAHSFQKLQVQTGSDELDIQAIENKGDDVFLIRVNTPPSADKARIQEFVMKEYGKKLKAIEAKYRAQLQAKDDQINQYRHENTNLWEMTKLMASRPINVEATAVSESKKYDLRESKFGGGFAAEGGVQIGGTFNDLSQAQDLTEATSQIQSLLAQLGTQDLSADAMQDEAAKNLAEQAKKDPTLMGKLVGWGKQLGGDAAKGATGEAGKVVGTEAGKIIIKALTLLGLSLI